MYIISLLGSLLSLLTLLQDGFIYANELFVVQTKEY